MSKPREFWITEEMLWEVSDKHKELREKPECSVLVREVVEISEAELKNASEEHSWKMAAGNAFEAGARWALAKLRGDGE